MKLTWEEFERMRKKGKEVLTREWNEVVRKYFEEVHDKNDR